MPFWPFLAVINFFVHFDQNNICVSIVLKLEQKEKKLKKFVCPLKERVYEFWNKNLKKNISSYVSFVLALKQ